MSGKRLATTELNHDNWDQEDEPEEKGVFKVASSKELQNRVIKKARRKLGGDGTKSEEAKSIFSGFTGFSTTTSNCSTANASNTPFSFFFKQNSSTKSIQEISKDEEKKSTNNFQFEKSNTYYGKLKGLNQAVSDWIKKHVDDNPLCILTPIFNDYEKYLKEIELDKKNQDNSKSVKTEFIFTSSSNPNGSNNKIELKESEEKLSTPESGEKKLKSIMSTESINEKSIKIPENNLLKFDSNTNKSLSFGQKADNAAVTSTSPPPFQFGFKNNNNQQPAESTSIFATPGLNVFAGFKPTPTAASSTTGFTFSGGKPFRFAKTGPDTQENKNTEEKQDDDEDLPPKVEFTPVIEEDTVYSKKCKIFIKQGSDYTDRGIGTLYLKPVKDTKKTQLLVRADTNLGNILLNLILNDAIPTQRMGKNNVMMVCIPTPESEQKPTPILIRVKSGEEADELLETIKKYKT